MLTIIFITLFVTGFTALVSLIAWKIYSHSKRNKAILPVFNSKSNETSLQQVVIPKSLNFEVKNSSKSILENFENDLFQAQTVLSTISVTSFRHPNEKEITFEREIGKGKFGKVWRGTWVRGNQSIRVALREWSPSNVDEKWMNLKSHNNIVQMLGILYCSSGRYLVTEYVSSGNLWDLLVLGPPLSEKQCLQMLVVVTQGLDFLHKNGVIHGDLSSKNILLKHTNHGWEPKLTDFGIASIVKPNDIDHIKIMAPEWFSCHIYSQETDLWALGCLYIQIFSCEELYVGKKLPELKKIYC